MLVRCLQIESPDHESEGDRIDRMIAELGAHQDADLVVLPELWATGYFSFDDYESRATRPDGLFVDTMRDAARNNGIWLHAGTYLERSQSGIANCALLIDPSGDVSLEYRKIHLFGYQSKEARILTAGDDIEVAVTPIGTIATSTCYDLRFPEQYRVLSDLGAEVVIIPAAWPLVRVHHWRSLLIARAIENQAWVISCNSAGDQRGTTLAGTSMIIDPAGVVVAEAGVAPAVIQAEVDVAGVAAIRNEFPVLEHRRIEIALRPRPGTSRSV